MTPPPFTHHADGPLAPGIWALDYLADGKADATLEVVDDGWDGFGDGVYKSEATSAVSLGLGRYSSIIIDRCDPSRHLTSSSGAVRQLSRIPGEVTVHPSRVTALGLTGTHLQLSVPVDVSAPAEQSQRAPTSWQSGTGRAIPR